MSTAPKSPTGQSGKATENDELAALKADFAQLREDVTAISEGLRELLQREQDSRSRRTSGEETATGDDEESAEESLRDEWRVLRERFEETRRHGTQTLDDVEEEVARHPLASLALAFGVGYLYARLTHLFR